MVNGRADRCDTDVLPVTEPAKDPLGRVCVDSDEDRALVGEMGIPPSSESSLCVFDITFELVVDGVRRDDVVSGVSAAVGGGGTRSAGFGDVLNVDPNDVYPLSYKLQYGTSKRRRKDHMSVYDQSIMGFTRSYRGHPGSVMFRWDNFAPCGSVRRVPISIALILGNCSL